MVSLTNVTNVNDPLMTAAKIHFEDGEIVAGIKAGWLHGRKAAWQEGCMAGRLHGRKADMTGRLQWQMGLRSLFYSRIESWYFLWL
jgi:hypothetical protein